MNWIDFTLAFANIVSMLGLLPTIFDRRSVIPRMSSIPKALAGTVTLPCYFALGVYATFTAAIVMCICWWTIVIIRAPEEL